MGIQRLELKTFPSDMAGRARQEEAPGTHTPTTHLSVTGESYLSGTHRCFLGLPAVGDRYDLSIRVTDRESGVWRVPGKALGSPSYNPKFGKTSCPNLPKFGLQAVTGTPSPFRASPRNGNSLVPETYQSPLPGPPLSPSELTPRESTVNSGR